MSVYRNFVADTYTPIPSAQPSGRAAVASPSVGQSQERNFAGRFGAASHDPQHPDRWRGAFGNPVNQDLASHLPTINARCLHEYHTNPFFRGVVRTYAMHVVGERGPTIQIQSDDKEFNEAVERRWKKIFKMPDTAGEVTGVDSLRMTVIHLMLGGSSLDVVKKRTVDPRREKVTFGWQTLPFNRLMTPPGLAGDPNIFMGIHFNSDGSRKQYYFTEQEGVVGGSGYVSLDPTPKPADMVQHIFLREEGEQATGAPWMACAVNDSASLAELDADVMEANKNAARNTTWLQDTFEQGNTFYAPTEINRGGMNHLPFGMAVSHSPATQSLAGYKDFRHEKLGGIGRGVHMPLILVMLSAQGSNFSSAQYDGTLYGDGIGETQSFLDQHSLEWKIEQVITEMILAGEIKSKPDYYEITANWPKPPHANFEKIVKALSTLYHDQAISLFDLCAYLGWDYETIARNKQKQQELEEMLDIRQTPLGVSDDEEKDEEEVDESPDESGEANEEDQGKEEATTSRTQSVPPLESLVGGEA